MLNNSIKYLEQLPLEYEPDSGNAESIDDNENKENFFENEISTENESGSISQNAKNKQSRVDSLIWAFRDIGFIYADLNPLGNEYQEHYTVLPSIKSGIFEKLVIEDFNLNEDDLEKTFFGSNAFNNDKRPLKEILDLYRQIYCSTVGVEFLHIQNKNKRKWFIQKLETERDKLDLTSDEKKNILIDLIQSEEFEHFLHKNYIGQKRFSIEGAEVVIPCLHFLVNSAVSMSVKEIVIGTSHRGRLTILNLILQQKAEETFSLFEDNYDPDMVDGSGDVKYHIGYSMVHTHADGTNIRVTIPANPSHLESVGPVVEGRARGIQDKIGDRDKKEVIPILLHGEAAFSGQGVVAETLNLSGLEGYSTGGTIHIIINNQVGFTTSPRSEHSSGFATDIAKSNSIPIIHVNGDDPIAAVKVMKLAIEYRQTFKSDVVVDIFCYRKYGHNEGDDPSFTHPHMYEIIKNHSSPASIYIEYCIKNNIVTKEFVEELKTNYLIELKSSFEKLHQEKKSSGKGGFSPHKIKYSDHKILMQHNLGLSEKTIMDIIENIHKVPENFKIHEKLERILETRLKSFKNNGTIDWAFAESIAFGSLLLDGHGVRLSGQDSERGTFSQRHLVWWETNTNEPKFYIPLNHLSNDQSKISVYDSPLSEYSILGFEYGYSLSCPDDLVMWEAQFGDFANGAQVIIDNYIVAAEAKWNVRNGIVLLLPHGYEGQGPEHSNAHLDRFLQMAAQENVQICNVTTPAQYYSLLRRQIILKVEKPLILMTPKSLLRHPLAVSKLEELKKSQFEYVLDDQSAETDNITKVLFCTGKIYYDLLIKKTELKLINAAIVRIEQLYPFPQNEIEKILTKYKTVKEKIWVQEEPQNRGAWTFIKYQFSNLFQENLQYIGRNPSASPAAGSLTLFKLEQEKIINDALK